MKHYGIFLDRNIDSNEKSFSPFQVRGNDEITERSLPPNFGACIRVVNMTGIMDMSGFII